MIASYEQKAKIAGGICGGSLVGLVILGRVLAATGLLSDTGTFDEGNTTALLVDPLFRLPSQCRYFAECGRTWRQRVDPHGGCCCCVRG
jgi:hypothetical protein